MGVGGGGAERKASNSNLGKKQLSAKWRCGKKHHLWPEYLWVTGGGGSRLDTDRMMTKQHFNHFSKFSNHHPKWYHVQFSHFTFSNFLEKRGTFRLIQLLPQFAFVKHLTHVSEQKDIF